MNSARRPAEPCDRRGIRTNRPGGGSGVERVGNSVLVVELNHAVFGGLAEEGIAGIWGDFTGEEILKAAHIQDARILLLAVPDQSTVRLAVERARQLCPEVTITARAVREKDVFELQKLGGGRGDSTGIRGRGRDGAASGRAVRAGWGCGGLIAEVRSEFYAADSLKSDSGPRTNTGR